MGVKVSFAHFKDAKTRGYKRLSNIFGNYFELQDLPYQERSLFDKVQKAIRSVCDSWKPQWVGIPIGSGFHIDHVITREAAITVYNGMNERNRPTMFFTRICRILSIRNG